MASLLYEILSGTQIFKGLSDEEVQERFSKGEFPPDAVSLPNSLVIYSGWSEEFAQELTKRGIYEPALLYYLFPRTSIGIIFCLHATLFLTQYE